MLNRHGVGGFAVYGEINSFIQTTRPAPCPASPRPSPFILYSNLYLKKNKYIELVGIGVGVGVGGFNVRHPETKVVIPTPTPTPNKEISCMGDYLSRSASSPPCSIFLYKI